MALEGPYFRDSISEVVGERSFTDTDLPHARYGIPYGRHFGTMEHTTYKVTSAHPYSVRARDFEMVGSINASGD